MGCMIQCDFGFSDGIINPPNYIKTYIDPIANRGLEDYFPHKHGYAATPYDVVNAVKALILGGMPGKNAQGILGNPRDLWWYISI